MAEEKSIKRKYCYELFLEREGFGRKTGSRSSQYSTGLAPWNTPSTEALSFHSRHYSTGLAPWNTPSTEALSFHSRHYSTGRDAKDAKFGENSIFFFAGLASWRDKLSTLISVNLRLAYLNAMR